ncbi:hypothetical protein ACLHDF_27930 [Priestia aryabhattai]|uniref:hypothetical protein n=1 Tax=Priestia megaterium TaxID=1404 RepID=UPI0039B98C7E
MGDTCFQITVLPNKNDKEVNESKDKKEAKQEASELSEAQKSSESAKRAETQGPVSQPIAKEEKKEAETAEFEAKKHLYKSKRLRHKRSSYLLSQNGHRML